MDRYKFLKTVGAVNEGETVDRDLLEFTDEEIATYVADGTLVLDPVEETEEQKAAREQKEADDAVIAEKEAADKEAADRAEQEKRDADLRAQEEGNVSTASANATAPGAAVPAPERHPLA